MSSFDLSSSSRPIEAGVILLGGETEILDVAPIDLLHGISKKFVHMLPVSDEIKAKAPEINFHWVTETGKPGKLTSNITIPATVCMEPPHRFTISSTITCLIPKQYPNPILTHSN